MRMAPVNPPRSVGARADEGGASARDEIGGVHVDAVRGLGDVQGHAHSIGEPLVGRYVELAHRLLVPEVVGLRKCVSDVNGIREVEAGRAVVHEREARADMFPNRCAQGSVTPRVTPGVEFDRRVAELYALRDDIEVLVDGGKGRCRGIGRDLASKAAQHLPGRRRRTDARRGPTRRCPRDRSARSGTPLSCQAPTSGAISAHARADRSRQAPREADARTQSSRTTAAPAILRNGDAGNALIGAKAQHADESVDGAASKSLTPCETWPSARCEDLEALDVSNAQSCH